MAAVPVSMVLYTNDAVDVRFSDGSRLHLSPCGSSMLYQEGPSPHRHPLTEAEGVAKWTQFVTSRHKDKVLQALDFRNRFAHRPFLCLSLMNPDDIVSLYSQVDHVTWTNDAGELNTEVLEDGSRRVVSLDEYASLVLSPHGQDFTVCYLSCISGDPAAERTPNSLLPPHRNTTVPISGDPAAERTPNSLLPPHRNTSVPISLNKHQTSTTMLRQSQTFVEADSRGLNVSEKPHCSEILATACDAQQDASCEGHGQTAECSAQRGGDLSGMIVKDSTAECLAQRGGDLSGVIVKDSTAECSAQRGGDLSGMIVKDSTASTLTREVTEDGEVAAIRKATCQHPELSLVLHDISSISRASTPDGLRGLVDCDGSLAYPPSAAPVTSSQCPHCDGSLAHPPSAAPVTSSQCRHSSPLSAEHTVSRTGQGTDKQTSLRAPSQPLEAASERDSTRVCSEGAIREDCCSAETCKRGPGMSEARHCVQVQTQANTGRKARDCAKDSQSLTVAGEQYSGLCADVRQVSPTNPSPSPALRQACQIKATDMASQSGAASLDRAAARQACQIKATDMASQSGAASLDRAAARQACQIKATDMASQSGVASLDRVSQSGAASLDRAAATGQESITFSSAQDKSQCSRQKSEEDKSQCSRQKSEEDKSQCSRQKSEGDSREAGVWGRQYSWVTQHFSCSHCPPIWRRPLTQLQRMDPGLGTLVSELGLRVSNKSAWGLNSKQNGSSSTSPLLTPLPAPLPLTCPCQHLHTWCPRHHDNDNQGPHAEFKQGGFKVIMMEGVIYRFVRVAELGGVEIYPGDGSVLVSQGRTAHFFVHTACLHGQMMERTYSIKALPPHTAQQPYNVTKLIKRGHRFLTDSLQATPLAHTEEPACWQRAPVQVVHPLRCAVLEEREVVGTARFTAFTNGRVRVLFHDRIALDMVADFSPRLKACLQHSSQPQSEDSVLLVTGYDQHLSHHRCRILLPSGQDLTVDLNKPGIYRRYTEAAQEWVRWVQSSPQQRQQFYQHQSHQYSAQQCAQAELKKIDCFNYVTEQLVLPPQSTLLHEQGEHQSAASKQGEHQSAASKQGEHQSAAWPAAHNPPCSARLPSNTFPRLAPEPHSTCSGPDARKMQMLQGFSSVREALLKTSQMIKDIDQLVSDGT